MLKRQRPATPPICVSELSPESPVLGHMDSDQTSHSGKRRRIAPPVLDGQQRGSTLAEDDEYEDEEELLNVDRGFAADVTRTGPSWQVPAGEYAEENTKLHWLEFSRHRRAQYMKAMSEHPPLQDWPRRSRGPGRSQTKCDEPSYTVVHRPNPGLPVFMEVEDSKTVKAKYEQQNRLLGSAVRNRMRESGYSRGDADEELSTEFE
ncbi:hypothetical protein BD410DRAFT_781079 [Rickenella mellea]|uniref:Uncharacterized protein n=1 Tax=Rickenella mellea TaxID=50990 RepID=A0A4Y7QME7_9AGAM|nr:hypothetical protein BD410DRAFT_781079 [Rickenella mellea]